MQLNVTDLVVHVINHLNIAVVRSLYPYTVYEKKTFTNLALNIYGNNNPFKPFQVFS